MAGTPGSYAVADWVAMDCLRLLKNMLEMAGYANFAYQDEFKKDFQPGDTVRVKFPQEFLVTDGFEYNAQAINRQTTVVTIDQPMKIGFEWDSIEAHRKANDTPAHDRLMDETIRKYQSALSDFAHYEAEDI